MSKAWGKYRCFFLATRAKFTTAAKETRHPGGAARSDKMTQEILDLKRELRQKATRLEWEGRFLAADVLWGFYWSLPK